MKTLLKHSTYAALVSLLSALTLSPVATAYDTDIYFSSAAGTGSTGGNHGKQPNILFVLDTSGSMQWDMSSVDSRSRISVLKNSMHTILDSAQNVNIGIMRFSRRGGAVVYPVADINADAGLVELQKTDTTTPVIVKGPFSTTNSVTASNGDAKEVQNATRTVDTTSTVLPAMSEAGIGTASGTVEVSITDGNDDGEERVGLRRYGPNLGFSRDRLTTVITPNNSGDDDQLRLLGFRFKNLNIPQGATITDARLSLKSTAKWGGETAWEISIDEDPKSGAFRYDRSWASLTANNAYTRLRDDSIDRGVVVPWRKGRTKKNQVIKSPNIKDLLQRVVSNASWQQTDNAVSLFMWPDYFTVSQYKKKEFYSGNSSAANRPKLSVSFDGSAPTVNQHKLGFHFNDLRVPQGAKILSAKLVVAAAQAGNSAVNMRIYAQNSDNAPAFSSTNSNISSRSKVGGTSWNIPTSEGWKLNNFYESPDIASVLQTVVDRNGWCGGNDVALILEGTGDRKIASYDSDPSLAPQLVIQYENDFSGSETGCTVDETSYQISSSSADADENTTTGSVNSSATSVRLGASQWSGFNFSGVRVPNGATIESATLTLKSSEAGSGSVLVRAHDVDSSSSFSTTPDNISTRPRTSASSNWNFNASAADQVMVSTNFNNVISEIVQRPGWVPGANMSVILQPQSGSLRTHSFEKAVFDSARLKIRSKYNLVVNIAGASGITVRQRLKNIVDQLPASGGTPATDTLHEAIRYLRGDRVEWGYSRWGSQSGRTSIPASYNPLTASVNIPSGCPGRDSSDYDCRNEYISQSPRPEYVSPILNTCQNTYVVLLSDGDPNTLYGESAIRSLTGGSCPDNDDTTCGESLARFMNTKDLLPNGLPGDQVATLHTIRFADDADPAYLKALATAGKGKYYEAPSEAALLAAFNNIVGEAVSKPQTFAAPSVALSAYNRLQTGSNLYYSMFLPHVSKRWEGNVKHYKLSASVKDIVGQNGVKAFENGNVRKEAQSFWSNTGTIDGDKVDSGGFGERITAIGYASRQVYTYTAATPPSNTAIKSTNNLFVRGNSRVLSMSQWPSGLTSTEKNDLIDWARGKDLDDSDGDGSRADTRWVLGDPLHAQPSAVTYDGGSNPDSSADDTVKIFIGTNAGFIHALDAKTGEEIWSFIPPEMLAIQQDLRNDADGTHIFGVDGRVTRLGLMMQIKMVIFVPLTVTVSFCTCLLEEVRAASMP